MATVNHSGGARLSRRFGADRPRTHPEPPRSPASGELPSQSASASLATSRRDRSRRGRRASTTGRHSFRSSKSKPPELPDGSPLVAVLSDVRLHLEVAHAAATVCAWALKGQRADSDPEISVVLQRLVADEIDRQMERLDAAIKGVSHGQ